MVFCRSFIFCLVLLTSCGRKTATKEPEIPEPEKLRHWSQPFEFFIDAGVPTLVQNAALLPADFKANTTGIQY
jgi:hypothetical protein